MKRIGTVLVFKPGIDPATAMSAIKWMEAVLDPDYYTPLSKCHGSTPSKVVVAEGGDKVLARIEPFEDEDGGPVWYIP